MAKPRNQSKTTKQIIKNQSKKKIDDQQSQKAVQKQQSWGVVKGILLACKHSNDSIQSQQQQQQQQSIAEEATDKKSKKMKCSGSLCSNTKVMHRPDQNQTASPELHKIKKPSHSSSNSSNSNSSSSILSSSTNNTEATSSRSMKVSELMRNNVNGTSSSSSSLSSLSNNSSSSVGVSGGSTGSFRGMAFRRFSGCYECRMVVDPLLGFTRDPSLRATICSCPHCGEIFMKPENLEHHQAVRHAVSELGAEDTSKNIVEIIFQSSWLKKKKKKNLPESESEPEPEPECPKIDRILKVHNTQTTISNFETYRDAVKSRAVAAAVPPPIRATRPNNPRCVADGNELLRFHAAAVACSLGLNGSTSLCSNFPHCHVCAIIRGGFKAGDSAGAGILTTATSGKAHDGVSVAGGGEKRAMLVCRVIAGRVKSSGGNNGGLLEEYDSLAGSFGLYSNLDELFVFNPKAILPCFVVIYSAF